MRTSRKAFVPQLAAIERRQTRIQRIRTQQAILNVTDPTPEVLEQHHVIGKLQNHPEDINIFLQKHSDDPAAKNFLQKLRIHLLPRIREIHSCLGPPGPANNTASTPNDVLFKANRFYSHALLRINYTTYDVRRGTDIVNSHTDHRHIMLLAHDDTRPLTDHPFCCARVLGVYHANIILTGPESMDYESRRLEFLWVQWFELEASGSWEQCSLDKGRFNPIHQTDAFGFIDPADVLRCCHLIPAFADG
ncbi:hypothetical protein SCLCIDRAFT_131028, partial [Scleroderma citrinum Foug A]